MRPASDDELLVSTDPEAFGTFYARHAASIQRYFAWRTGDPELAADLTSETFAAALLARRRFKPGGAPAEAWLYTIAARRLVDHRRRAAGAQRMREVLVNDAGEAARDDARHREPAPRRRQPRDARSTPGRAARRRRRARARRLRLPGDLRGGRHLGGGRAAAGLARPRGAPRHAARLPRGRGSGRPVPAVRARCRPRRTTRLARAREGLDCSSFSSLVLKRAGLFAPDHAWTSGRLADWGEPGEGRCLTVWANDEHVWLEFRLGDRRTERFDASPRETRRTAAGGRPASDATPRHPPGA